MISAANGIVGNSVTFSSSPQHTNPDRLYYPDWFPMRNSKGFLIEPSASFVASTLYLRALGAMPRFLKLSEKSCLRLRDQDRPSHPWTAKRNHGYTRARTITCLSLRLIFVTYTHNLGVLLYVLFLEEFSHMHLHWRWHFPSSQRLLTDRFIFAYTWIETSILLQLRLFHTLDTIHIKSTYGNVHSWYHWMYSAFLSAFVRRLS